MQDCKHVQGQQALLQTLRKWNKNETIFLKGKNSKLKNGTRLQAATLKKQYFKLQRIELKNETKITESNHGRYEKCKITNSKRQAILQALRKLG